jgi:maltose alpha-D-glucosyltransferase/alpha-amylase
VEDRDPYAYLKEMRSHIQWLCGDAVIMAEANLAPEEVPNYFGDGDKIHMSFNFWVNQRLFLALAREDANPIRKAYDELPDIHPFCQWNNFLRSHDELDLGRLSGDQLQEVFRAFGPDENMQLYGRGIRRRLAPMLGNDRRRLELAHSLMLTLPGTPVLRYGDEIGMGDDLELPDRQSVRTPMQWSGDRNGGFSTTAPEQLCHPVISDGEFAYEKVNVELQQRDPDSLLNWLERAIRARKSCPEFGTGRCVWLDTGNSAVLAHRCEKGGSRVYAVHNLSSQPVTVTIPIGGGAECLHDLLSKRPEEVQHDGHKRVDLEPFGFRWFREERNGKG